MDDSVAKDHNIENSLTAYDLCILRENFWNLLKAELQPNSKGIYIAPGMDPVPAYVFKSDVLYYGLPSDLEWYELIKQGKVSAYNYREYSSNKGPIPNLRSEFGDILTIDHKDEEFDFLIVRDAPPKLYNEPSFLYQIDRILKKGGKLIFDCDFVRKMKNGLYAPDNLLLVEALLNKGYSKDKLDCFSGKKFIFPDNEKLGDLYWLEGIHEFRSLIKPK